MDKIDLMKQTLQSLDVPVKQQSDLCALTLLAMAGIKPESEFTSATNEWVRIHDVIVFIKDNYAISYAENSRETFRKQAMHHFRTAAFIEDNGKATNSPNYRYRLTPEFLRVIKNIKEMPDGFVSNLENPAATQFLREHETLKSIYASKKTVQKMPVKINNKEYTFSNSTYNQINNLNKNHQN